MAAMPGRQIGHFVMPSCQALPEARVPPIGAEFAQPIEFYDFAPTHGNWHGSC